MLAFLFILTPFTPVFASKTSPVSATTVITTYPSKYYNIDSNGKVTKHIFANGVEIAIVTGTGVSAVTGYVQTDNLGSTNVVSDAKGNIAQTLDYFPFGAPRINSGTDNPQRQFIGQMYDADTSLSYLNARYYDGKKGQFISQDPVFWEIGQTKDGKNALSNPQAMNSYSYAGNNPITNSDPSGKFAPVLIVAAGILAMYAPQITSFSQSLMTPLGQVGVSQVIDDANKGNYGMAVIGAVTAGEIPKNSIPKGLYLGQDFGKLGKVVKTTPGELKSFTNIVTKDPYHGLNQAISRGISPQLIQDTVKNPLIKLQQDSNSVYLNKQAGVVLDKLGGLITTYHSSEFKVHISNVLKSIK
ncbi:MAG: RHS repeat-associated core domain-containing protein [Patescibacteria group bacterium]